MAGPGISRPIGDYALLSDCHSTALVSSEGSVDWACLRRFDSGSVFARLLDHRRGGHFSIRPTDAVTTHDRRYVGPTMVLETTMTTATGTVRVVDAFAMRIGGMLQPRAQLLRRVEGVTGEVGVEVIVEPRFDYASIHPWLRWHGAGRFSAIGGNDALVLDTDLPLELDVVGGRLHGRRSIAAGERFAVTIVSQPAHRLDVDAVDCTIVDDLLIETTAWWTEWSSNTEADGPYRAQLERSALVLKSLCCAPTGAIIAAPTTSLPEISGGSANWDYRYCWVRDATLTLDALAGVGHHEVAQGFRDFVMRSAAGHGDELQIMYGSYGEHRLPEIELDLDGWRGSRPVRIGNGAASQTQLDVFGHLLDAAHLWHERSGGGDGVGGGIDADEWRFLCSVIDRAAALSGEPDSGIWELRGPPRHYVYSKVMIWVALDRGIRLVDEYGLGDQHADVAHWRTIRAGVRTEVERWGVDAERGNFVQYYGTREVDASLLKLPLVGFVGADDPRMVATVEAIQRDLAIAPDGFVRRFRDVRSDAATGGPEGVFLLCSFWLVEVLVMQGRVDEAAVLFDRLIGLGNDLDLFAEEYDTVGEELLGNYPQAFTHLGLIAAAKRLRGAQP